METDSILQEWNLTSDLHTKEAILSALATRIRQILATDPMAFIQAMYRLDIPEAQLDAAMEAPDAAERIAVLVWDRQAQKDLMRKTITPRSVDEEDESMLW